MSKRGKLLAAAIGVACAISIGGWAAGNAGGAQTKVQAKPLTVDLGLPPTTLDPAEVCSLTEFGLSGSFYARLTQYGSMRGPGGMLQYDPDTRHAKPWLARSWKVNRARTVYTFTLQRGLKFPSGRPVNSKAFKFSLERVVKMNGCGNAVVQESQFKPPLFKSIRTPTPYTLVVHYSRPNPNALQDLAQPAAGVVDPSVVNAHGGVKKNSVNTWMASHTAGYGPFLLKSYEPDRQMVLTANPAFVDQPASKEIIINLIHSDPTLLLQARSGAADVTLYLSKQAVNSLKGNPCCRIVANDLTMTEYLNLPETTPALKNRLFRKALTYAVPYSQILKKIAYGYGKLYYGEWMPAMPWFDPKVSRPRPFNLSRAKQLIAQSGVKTPVSFPIILPEGDQTSKDVATAISGVWAELGVRAQVRQVSPTEHINVVYTTHTAPTMYYDGPGVVAPDYLWGYDGRCHNPFNDLLVCIPKADRLMAKIPYTTNQARRQQILNKVQQLWVADSPRIPVYQDQFVAVLNKRVKTYYFDHELDLRRWRR